jgi:hypothetical protein
MLVSKTIKSRPAFFHFALSDVSDDHPAAIEGWKTRKDQLQRQQSVTEVSDEAEKVDLLSLSKQKDGRQVE